MQKQILFPDNSLPLASKTIWLMRFYLLAKNGLAKLFESLICEYLSNQNIDEN